MYPWLLAAALACAITSANANNVAIAALKANHAALDERLQKNAFNRPLVIESRETSNRVTGEIHAVINQPFTVVGKALNNPDHWCDVMSLPMNTKYCRAVTGPSGTVLKVNIGKKSAEALNDANRVEFDYTVVDVTPQFFDIRLHAKSGPLGTSNYRIAMEAIPISSSKTFLHLTYSYSVNFAGRLALQSYLATIGSGKVGFTRVGQQDGSAPSYIDGVRGLIERNTMRYYLAINSFLESSTEAPPNRLEKRLQSWFSAIEMYPRQLHEMERGEYLAMKRDEYQRQQITE